MRKKLLISSQRLSLTFCQQHGRTDLLVVFGFNDANLIMVGRRSHEAYLWVAKDQEEVELNFYSPLD